MEPVAGENAPYGGGVPRSAPRWRRYAAGVEATSDLCEGTPGKVVGNDSPDGSGFPRFETSADSIAVGCGAVPEALAGALLMCPSDTCSLMGGFVMGEGNEIAGEHAPLVRGQIKGAAMYGVDTNSATLGELEQLLELTWLPVETVNVPYEDHRLPQLGDLLNQPLERGTRCRCVGGKRLVDELRTSGMAV